VTSSAASLSSLVVFERDAILTQYLFRWRSTDTSLCFELLYSERLDMRSSMTYVIDLMREVEK